MSTQSFGLHHVATDDLHKVLRAIHRDHLLFPITRGGLVLARFGDLEAHLSALVGLDRAAALAVLMSVLGERSERQTATQSTAQRGCELAFRGAVVPGDGRREPVDHVRELLATAEHSVVWAGIPAASRSRVLTTLHAAQRGRGLDVRLFVTGERQEVEAFRRESFPHGEPRPRCHVVPPGGALPPACLVVDNNVALLFNQPGEGLESEDDDGLGAAFVAYDKALASSLTAHLEAAMETHGYICLVSVADAPPG